ncbi:hypothetical protein TREPR_3201 [Treponema primitia ZAS-2]|uniref:Major outer membrane protein n=1 Tax=Treponema primitia (strain ATCC BAA-887 / DSM 12427 / ZAS-2) TaxID=545694 RepID=F5YL11_TREPZ|nr:hypothetical protein [Treponema primitia]AEF85445.1 hypothetical protein TREPR_3201 [Treponema primitia ZAS-2]
MKKTLVVLLILAVAGSLFAQELKLSGDVSTGFESSWTEYSSSKALEGTNKKKVTDENARFYSYAADNDSAALRARLTGVYTNGNVSAYFRLRTKEAAGSETTPELAYFYAKAKAFNILELSAGNINNTAWNTGGENDADVGEGVGVLAQLIPISGLNVGAGIYMPKAAYRDQLAYSNFTYGIAYTAPKLVKVALSGRTAGQEFDRLDAGVSVLAINNLGFIVEALSHNINAETPAWQIDQVISYNIGKLDFGITVCEFLGNYADPDIDYFTPLGFDEPYVNTLYDGLADDGDYKLGYKFNPWVSYNLGIVVPKLSVVLGGGGINKETGRVPGDVNFFTYSINPSVLLQVAPTASVEFGFDYTNANYEYAWKSIGTTTIEHPDVTVGKTSFTVDFRYTF